MSRSKGKAGEPSGLLVFDKPLGVTSHDVVAAVRDTLHMRRVGHAGTLDPMATGVLIVGFGHATRLMNFIVDHHKTYEATIRLGQSTTTDDSEGEIVASTPTVLGDEAVTEAGAAEGSDGIHRISRELVERTIAERLTGTIEQVPSSYSAIKVNGRRAYELARDGREVKLEARSVTIDEFTVLTVGQAKASTRRAYHADTDSAATDEVNYGVGTTGTAMATDVVDVRVRVTCSAGTYIRSLGRDLGDLLGVGGYLTSLRRTKVGRFSVTAPHVVVLATQPHTFTNREGETVTRNRAVIDQGREELLACAMSMNEAVHEVMPVLAISADEAQTLRFGRRLPRAVEGTSAAVVERTGEVVALVEPTGPDECKPVVGFPKEPARSA